MKYIKSLKQTKIIASHDLEFIYEVTNKVILINKGKIVKIGETEKILSDEELLNSNRLYVPLSLKMKRLMENKSIV